MDDSVGSVAAVTTSNGKNTEASAVPLLARWSRLFAATPQVDDDQGRVRASARGSSRTKLCSPQRRISIGGHGKPWPRRAAARLAQAAIRPLVHLGLIISNAWSRRPRLGPLAHARSLPR